MIAVLAGGIGPLAGGVGVVEGGPSVGVVGASSITMSVIMEKQHGVAFRKMNTTRRALK